MYLKVYVFIYLFVFFYFDCAILNREFFDPHNWWDCKPSEPFYTSPWFWQALKGCSWIISRFSICFLSFLPCFFQAETLFLPAYKTRKEGDYDVAHVIDEQWSFVCSPVQVGAYFIHFYFLMCLPYMHLYTSDWLQMQHAIIKSKYMSILFPVLMLASVMYILIIH